MRLFGEKGAPVGTADILSMSLTLVWRHRRRYKHTAAGMALGSAGLVLIIALGGAIDQAIMERLDVIGGATVLHARSIEVDNPHPVEFGTPLVDTLRSIAHVTAAAPVVSIVEVAARTECCRWRPGLVGVDASYWRMTYASIVSGRPITNHDVENKHSVCVVAPDAVTHLFEGRDPLGRIIHIGNEPFRVVGVLGGVEMRNTAHEVYIPITVASAIFPGMSTVKDVFLRVDHVDNVRHVSDRVMELLDPGREEHAPRIRLTYFPERIEKVRAVLADFRFVATAAFALVLVVGGVGLMRNMLAAIQERTREIGLRKALGAFDSMIFLQFLVESASISLLGSALGVMAAVLAAACIRVFVLVDVSCGTLCLAIIFCLFLNTFVGILSGVYPAVQAGKLDPAAAMRFE